MPQIRTDEIYAHITEQLGESFRGVLWYDSGANDYRLREAASSIYSEEAGLFHLGEFEANIRVFEKS